MNSRFQIGTGDAVEFLRRLPPESADLIVTDPPYESLEKHRAVGTTTRLKVGRASNNGWFRVFPNARFPELLRELHRVLRRNRHFYLFCDPETMFVVKSMAEEVGFRFWKPLIWDKKRIGLGYHYRSRYECILFFEKGKRRLADLGVPDVLGFPRVIGGYPAQKPVELIEVLVRQSSAIGEVVLDPFAGSGSVGLAALRHSRKFIGHDLEPAAVELARARLTAEGERMSQYQQGSTGIGMAPDPLQVAESQTTRLDEV